jgi:hypothetical protein
VSGDESGFELGMPRDNSPIAKIISMDGQRKGCRIGHDIRFSDRMIGKKMTLFGIHLPFETRKVIAFSMR